ncbi:MAG: cysteine desulfurase family protein [Patescibacteria group bacterium]
MFKKSPKRTYLDYASLTPIDPVVVKEMEKYSTNAYANPSSLYKEGVAAKKTLEEGRGRVATFLGAHPDEVIFTSGGTEANNLAIIGAVEALREQGVEYRDMHVVTSVIEHSSVRECINYLNERDVKNDVVGVDQKGIVDLEHLEKVIKPNTVIVSIMTVNNEIGSIQSIREIAKIIRRARKKFAEGSKEQGAEPGAFNFQSLVQYPLFHTDAAQAPLFNELNVEKLGVDLLTLDSSKVYGPRGVGCLYKKRNVPLEQIIHGGGQESGLRSGTEPIPQIMGFARALDLASGERVKEIERISVLRDQFIKGLMILGKGIRINGALGSPHILNISIPRIDSEFFLLQLDAQGIACSTKSSCLRDEDESYVLKAIEADSKSSLRFSFGRWTTSGDVEKALKALTSCL